MKSFRGDTKMSNSKNQENENVLYKDNFIIKVHANSPSANTLKLFQEGLAEVLQHFNTIVEGE